MNGKRPEKNLLPGVAVRRRAAISAIAAAPLAVRAVPARDQRPEDQRVLRLTSSSFRVELDPHHGGITSIAHPSDRAAMSWVSGPSNAPWQRLDAAWGLGYADVGSEQLHRGRWQRPARITATQEAVTATYRVGRLEVTVTRRIAGDALQERFVFRNVGDAAIDLGGASGRLAIYTPFNDNYTNTADVLEHRCHAHIWTGGASSWVAMMRMGGRGPHLGLVLTEGSLDSYSIEGRETATSSNTRGTVLLHPLIGKLEPGQGSAVEWKLFWHTGWEDFFSQAVRRSSQMVRINASRWTALPGEAVELSFEGQLGRSPRISVNATDLSLSQAGTGWKAVLPPQPMGELKLTLTHGDGLRSRLVLNSVPALETLVEARVRFITEKQQWAKPGDGWDGAYIVYDNDVDAMVRTPPGPKSDRNEARERLGMGVLVARWLRDGNNSSPVRASLDRYYRFVCDRLQRSDGFVLDGVGSTRKRLYNWPWAMHLHLEMAALTGASEPLDAFVRTIDSFYREGGADFYPIGLPVKQGLDALKTAGREGSHRRVLDLIVAHGQALARRGVAYPPSEVNFEQAIVAPAAILLLELFEVTGDRAWVRHAEPHLQLLALFEGRQPDHRLHGVSIRHWDGYWFGKSLMWGDTFPHYWSSLNALAWDGYARATGSDTWARRADDTMRANYSLFTAAGRASAAYIYPKTVDGRPGQHADAYANDQDWALVHALGLRRKPEDSK